jgi:hypothetical protein
MGEPLLSGEAVKNWTGIAEFHAKLTFGTASLSTVQTRELSVARTSAGKYTVTLPRSYRNLCEFRAMKMDTSGAVLSPVVQSDTVATDGKMVFELRTEAGVATDPDLNTKLMIVVAVSNDPFNDAVV